jgi:hypothetical protein
MALRCGLGKSEIALPHAVVGTIGPLLSVAVPVFVQFDARGDAVARPVVVTQWQDPSLMQIRFTKILAMCVSNQEALRRQAEGELCAQISGIDCKPAYLVIPDALEGKPDEAKALLQRAGFDGAVVLRVVDAREKVTYVPPSYGPTFWGYYRYAWPQAYDPGYYRKDRIVSIETSIYSVTRDALLWVGTTETMNPTSLPKTIEEVTKAVRAELVHDQLIPAK